MSVLKSLSISLGEIGTFFRIRTSLKASEQAQYPERKTGHVSDKKYPDSEDNEEGEDISVKRYHRFSETG